MVITDRKLIDITIIILIIITMLIRAVPQCHGVRPIINSYRVSVRRNSTSTNRDENIVKCSPELCSKSCAMFVKSAPRHWTKEDPIATGKMMCRLACLHNVPPSGASPKVINLIVEASIVKAELEKTKLDDIADNIGVGTLGLLTVSAVTSAILTSGLASALSLGVAIYGYIRLVAPEVGG